MTPLVKKWTLIIAVLAALTGGIDATRARGGGFGGGGFGRGGFNVRQMILGREQQNVISPDDEWALIEPKLWKVVTLQAAVGGPELNFAANAIRRIASQNAAQLEMDAATSALLTEMLQRENDLMAALNDPNIPDTQVGIKLRDYRTSRDKARLALKAAQADLQNILTLRQEAILIQDGFMQ